MNSALIYLAQLQQQGPEFGKSSPVGLVIIVVLLIGTALLIYSMNKRIKKLPARFSRGDSPIENPVSPVDPDPKSPTQE